MTVDDRARLGRLAALVPILGAPDADFGHWEQPPPVNGVHTFGWYELGRAGEAFRAATGGWIIAGFDWRSWLESEDGRRYRDTPASVADAPVEDIGKLFTAIVRSDRFVEGSIAGAFESVLLLGIARRAAALLAAGRADDR